MEKILLVEDDPSLGEVVKDQLELNGYEVSLLRQPDQTVDELLENKVDLVILDKLLSGIDGTNICSEIRNTEPVSDIPVLMMSGWDGARKACMDAGANNFIEKPFGIGGFLESVKATIGAAKDFEGKKVDH